MTTSFGLLLNATEFAGKRVKLNIKTLTESSVFSLNIYQQLEGNWSKLTSVDISTGEQSPYVTADIANDASKVWFRVDTSSSNTPHLIYTDAWSVTPI